MKRKFPEVLPVVDKGFVAQSYPGIVSFKAEVKDAVVSDTLLSLIGVEPWYWAIDLRDRQTGEVKLDADWSALEVDDCLDGHTVEFRFCERPVFKAGYWRGRLTVTHDVSKLVREQLRNVILTFLANNHKPTH